MLEEREVLLNLSMFLEEYRLTDRYTISYGAIGIIFLVSGLSIPWKTLVDNITKLRLHLVVQVTSYLVVSLQYFI
jgi:predicted Na+-dependent transporter